MRACAAACAAFILLALGPVPRAAAQCVCEAPRLPADTQADVPAKPPPLVIGRPPSEAGTLALPSAALARAAATTAQMANDAAALPGAIAPRAYRPYQMAPAPHPLTAETVASSLEGRGFRKVSAVRQRGQSFLAEATGPRGERVRLVLDAASGDISGMQIIGAAEPR